MALYPRRLELFRIQIFSECTAYNKTWNNAQSLRLAQPRGPAEDIFFCAWRVKQPLFLKFNVLNQLWQLKKFKIIYLNINECSKSWRAVIDSVDIKKAMKYVYVHETSSYFHIQLLITEVQASFKNFCHNRETNLHLTTISQPTIPFF
jgi:hypothetical protein